MKRCIVLSLIAAVGLSSSCFAQADSGRPQPQRKPDSAGDRPRVQAPADAKPAGQPGMEDPEAMMKAYVEAAKPGPMHEKLMKGAGVWDGQMKHWMDPSQPPMESTCVTTCTPMVEGRFLRCEVSAEMPGMGKFTGYGIYGYDNVAKEFQLNWVDNMGSGMTTGTGELSDDGKVLTWTMTFNCPIANGPMKMRQVETFIDENHNKMEMFAAGPDGKEMKVMEIMNTRRAGSEGTRPGDAVRPTLRGTDEPRR